MIKLEQYLRELPAVDRLLREPPLEALRGRLPHKVILAAAQETVEQHRQKIRQDCSRGEPVNRESFLPRRSPGAKRPPGLKAWPGRACGR